MNKEKAIEEYSTMHEKLIRESYDECVLKPQSNYLTRKLAMRVAEWLLGSEEEEASKLPAMPNERFITLMQFAYKYPGLCHPSYLCKHFAADERFVEWCGKKEKCRWYIQPKRAVRYLSVYGEARTKNKAVKLI